MILLLLLFFNVLDIPNACRMKVSLNDGHVSSSGELLAHELLGHGMPMSMGYSLHEIEAVQATNLFLRSTGITSYQRRDHGAGIMNGNPTEIPYYLNSFFTDFNESWK